MGNTNLGKLDLQCPLQEMIAAQQNANDLKLLPITLPHIYALADLENYHQDPERLLITQSIVESMPLVTGDSKILRYPVVTIK